eukprot:5942295-Prymnesium_polylepis.1
MVFLAGAFFAAVVSFGGITVFVCECREHAARCAPRRPTRARGACWNHKRAWHFIEHPARDYWCMSPVAVTLKS